MTKPELGTKRICAGCSAKFYDSAQDPDRLPGARGSFRSAEARGSAAAALIEPAPRRCRWWPRRERGRRVTESEDAAVGRALKTDGDTDGPNVPLLEEIDED